jgi:dTMP kinase
VPPSRPGAGSGGLSGRFVTLEGIEGSGKSTQAALLAVALRRANYEVVQTREPGGTPLAEWARNEVLERHVDAKTELFLYLAARTDHVSRHIRPALDGNAWVVCDRFNDATLAYQGYGRKLPMRKLKSLLKWANDLVPDLTLLVDVPVEVGLARAGLRGHTNRLDREDLPFHRRVRRGYLALAKAEPDRIAVLDGTGTIDEVHALICSTVAERLGVAALSARGKA